MVRNKNGKKRGLITIAVVLFGVFFAGILGYIIPWIGDLPTEKDSQVIQRADEKRQAAIENQKAVEEGTIRGDIIVMPTIDFKDLKHSEQLQALMASRKEKLGIKKSLDMIVRSDEVFVIGDTQVSMRDILEKAFVKKGEVFQEKIEDSGAVRPQKMREFGIYVIQPGDNIWNIHFNILKEFYDFRGIRLSAEADEPVDEGMSSGIGKILKFSETLVIIYNLIEQKVDSKIDLLEPLSKIVIYNMDDVLSLLKEVNYDNIDRLRFDGKTIWIPAKKS